MNNIKFIKTNFIDFKKHWLSYLFLIILSNVFTNNIIVPFLKFIANILMTLGDIPYISYTNILEIITKNPIISILLFLLLLLLVTIVFIQFTFLLLAIFSIQNNEVDLLKVIKETFYTLKNMKPSVYIYLLFYFILIWPFSITIFNTPLLNKVVIPNFILDFIYNNFALSLLLVILFTIIFLIGIRLIFSIPFIILKKYSLKDSIKLSLKITKNKYIHYLIKFFLIILISTGIFMISFTLIYILQNIIDILPKPIPLIGGIINLTAIEFLNQITTTLGIVCSINVFLKSDYFNDINLKYIGKNKIANRKSKSFVNKFTIGANSIFLILLLISNAFFLNETVKELPVTISHRGVNNKNGVQNTIPALYRTMELNPDYIEIDIQETKDHEFVVIHDENLNSLAGINKSPSDLTLKELTNLTVSENGYSAKIASFDEYLGHANKYRQKLLIEIKTTNYDSEDMLDNFLRKYEKNMIKKNHIFQTLDYELVKEFKKKAPDLYISYILPVNFIFPRTDANGYTMEETTLDLSFIGDASTVGKKVFSWTVNDTNSMLESIYLDVDGIITDNLKDLNNTINTFNEKPTFADRIMTYLILIPD